MAKVLQSENVVSNRSVEKITLPDGRILDFVEWREHYLTTTIETYDTAGGWDRRVLLFGPDDFQHDEYVLQSLKVDTELPPRSLALLWVRFTYPSGDTLEFPCSAFDRNVLRYVDVSEPEEEGERLELREVAPVFRIPLLVKGEASTVHLYAKQDFFGEWVRMPITFTLGTFVKQDVKIK